ncbi:Diaminopimelate epimerase [Labilithrix luteola]|uniref:Diaminopimelate epimerase n=1 Tax=Labilithrix luteola TaxID=1391654 RepID=A0A0K1PTA5_9BACT|nr:diaminopimelate epimerase [Labilithrix luteola]AKU96765.1 Diaminopimelate epimerase [Labilithrix luteola]
MEAFAFHKYEGLGNDFIIVEADRDDAVPAAVAKALCDRRFGIGGDGILLLLPPTSSGARGRMRVINADGSVPEMCGNGLRCAVLYAARVQGVAEGEILFDTDAGKKPCLIDDRDGRGLVTVDMGPIRVDDDITLDLGDGEPWTFTPADAGNPHVITTRAASRADIDAVGPRVATHSRFPAGTNVEFAVYRKGAVDLVVWERGVGLTLACGTGACATVAVGVRKGLISVNEEVAVNLPGGPLSIKLRDDGHAIMRGPARHVFSGTLTELPPG